MYMLKDGLYFKFNQSEASKIIGITQPTMNNIIEKLLVEKY